MNMDTNLIECKVDNRWTWSLENASLTFESPKGGHVRIDKRKFNKLTDEQRGMIYDIYQRVAGDKVELSISEMNDIMNIGKIAGDVYLKRK